PSASIRFFMKPTIPGRTLSETARWVVDELLRRGVELKPGTRWLHYRSQFANNAYALSRDESHLLEGQMALRDVEELALVLHAFPELGGGGLQKLADDAIVPRIDRSTPGRDRQFELFVAAVCRRGGLETRLDREPDLWCCASKGWLALAAK